MNFIIYDLETTGRSPYWDQIIQIGAIVLNDQMLEIERFDYRCKLKPGIVPYPKAIMVNKTEVRDLKSNNLSHYGLMNFVKKHFQKPVYDY